jgi:RNA polymerase sigma-70 factor (ECF subfamily)
MHPKETKIGGNRESFPETAWLTVLSTKDPKSRRALLEQLCTLYWKPVYKFIRASWGKNIESAKDLTQEFFAKIIDSELISNYEPSQGRFRYFLKGALRNFLAVAHRDAERLKRGGGAVTIPLDVQTIENGTFSQEIQRFTPEQIYDREWAQGLMVESLAELKRRLLEEGKELQFRAFEAYNLAPDAPPTYEEIARQLNAPLHDVRNYISRSRARLRELVVERVSQYVASSKEVEDELRQLAEYLNR